VRLNAFIPWSRAVETVVAVAELFREEQILRARRERARLKYLFLKHGWTAESFLERLEDKMRQRFDPAPAEVPPDDIYRDHVGIHRQKQRGLYYLGAAVLRGRLSAAQLSAAADLAERFGAGQLRTTNMQNLLIINVPETKAQRLAQQLQNVQLPVEGSPFWRGAIACTGTEFCKLAITETKGFTRWLVEQLEERLPEFDQQLKLHVTGCPNSCGQHWIADIGLEGKKLKTDGRLVDAYYFCVGGAVGLHQRIARPLGYRCLAQEVPEALERLLRGYLAHRSQGENLRSFFSRQSDEDLRTLLAGTPVATVARDPSPGRVPYGVAG
jgi:sulfite reductase (ferredoxin)